MPAVEPGCIIEYRWREVRVNTNANYVRLQFQRDIPVQRVQYLDQAIQLRRHDFQVASHCTAQSSPWVKEKDGFYSTTMTNMPAIHEESRMPPEDQVKTWMLVYYQKPADDKINPDKYWTDYAKRFYDVTKSLIKPNDEVKKMAATLVADAKTDDEKLERLFEFCRTKIKNISNDASGLTPDERAKLKDNKNPSDTLKRGMGTSVDIDLLICSTRQCFGFRRSHRTRRPIVAICFSTKHLPNAYFIDPRNIAVNVGGTWKFFNPGYSYIPFGMLRWQEEGQQALITDPKTTGLG